ncbi:rhodanese-like domain-containing protein [Micromonospora sp. WMMD882]|uniref:rhodanese-like domain-containing protein n=1 Tax=Micromonospora sp. WMMD882 TaxID=3015151 RepID=UPI00248CE924|nr:rhodanese-like domain-containing protein [Micromonospora sp. WMMD882]WBB77759.1 rhodanese-like domain-containing protein [Micromonospora sp. WMMD882]
MSHVLMVPPAPPEQAAAHFAARLSVETDVSDVYADLTAGVPGLVVVDTRGDEAWAWGRLPGAVHLPTARIPTRLQPGAGHGELGPQRRVRELVPAGATVVTYCWGPGCNGATRAALAFARLGYPVKEMIGGFEYWVREGLPVRTDSGTRRRPVDALTAPPTTPTCAC